MKLDEKTIRTYLAWYGTDVNAWPLELQPLGNAAQQQKEFTLLFVREKRFELLLSSRRSTPASPQLADRIIAAARMRPRHESMLRSSLAAASSMLRPSAVAAMIVLGFAIGFGALAPAPQHEPQISQTLSDDEGAML